MRNSINTHNKKAHLIQINGLLCINGQQFAAKTTLKDQQPQGHGLLTHKSIKYDFAESLGVVFYRLLLTQG